MAASSLAMMSFGVPFGAHKPCQNEAYSPGTPASSMVGTSGAAHQRSFARTAKALSCPWRT